MTSICLSWTWVLLALFLPVSEAGGKGGGGPAATPYPAPSGQGLFAVVQTLVQQVADINVRHAKDRSRMRRAERRSRSARSDTDVMHADVIQLRQHVTEINTRLDGFDDLTSDLQLEVSRVTSLQQRLQEEVGRGRGARRGSDERLDRLEKNVSRLHASLHNQGDWLRTRVAEVERSLAQQQTQSDQPSPPANTPTLSSHRVGAAHTNTRLSSRAGRHDTAETKTAGSSGTLGHGTSGKNKVVPLGTVGHDPAPRKHPDISSGNIGPHGPPAKHPDVSSGTIGHGPAGKHPDVSSGTIGHGPPGKHPDVSSGTVGHNVASDSQIVSRGTPRQRTTGGGGGRRKRVDDDDVSSLTDLKTALKLKTRQPLPPNTSRQMQNQTHHPHQPLRSNNNPLLRQRGGLLLLQQKKETRDDGYYHAAVTDNNPLVVSETERGGGGGGGDTSLQSLQYSGDESELETSSGDDGDDDGDEVTLSVIETDTGDVRKILDDEGSGGGDEFFVVMVAEEEMMTHEDPNSEDENKIDSSRSSGEGEEGGDTDVYYGSSSSSSVIPTPSPTPTPTPLTTHIVPTLTMASVTGPTPSSSSSSPPSPSPSLSASLSHLTQLQQRVEDLETRLDASVLRLDSSVENVHSRLNDSTEDLHSRLSDSTEDLRSRFNATAENISSRLNASVHDLDSRLNSSLDSAEEARAEVARLRAAVTQRDEAVQHVQTNVGDLGATVSRLAAQLAELRLGDFMQRLQASLVNFTANVLTLEQWQLASQQMMNSTQRTQLTLSQLAQRLVDQEEVTSELTRGQGEQRVLGAGQYRLLQAHVIRLNNSLQDLQDHVDNLRHSRTHNKSPVWRHGRREPGRVSSLGQQGQQGQRGQQGQQGQWGQRGQQGQQGQQGRVLTTRVEDLALQLVYSDNRLSHLETSLLNASLSACARANSDLYQDASLSRLDQQAADARRDVAQLRESLKRLDLGLYRLHGRAKDNQQAVRKVQGQVKDAAGLARGVLALRKEVDNLLFQLPTDCHDYYERGYRHSGDYIIHPRTSQRSLKVRCLMHTNNNNDRNDTRNDSVNDNNNNSGNDTNTASSGGVNQRVDLEEGGWTVIQQRSSGRVNFTRSWAEYAAGFGSTSTEYWLGNDATHLLTLQRNYTLALNLRDVLGGHWRAVYTRFAVAGQDEHYRLTLAGYRGNCTDSLRYAAGATFSTWDRDTDGTSSPCARYNGGGWWYRHCQISNLNGPYRAGVIWFHTGWHDWLQLDRVVMMVRPSS